MAQSDTNAPIATATTTATPREYDQKRYIRHLDLEVNGFKITVRAYIPLYDERDVDHGQRLIIDGKWITHDISAVNYGPAPLGALAGMKHSAIDTAIPIQWLDQRKAEGKSANAWEWCWYYPDGSIFGEPVRMKEIREKAAAAIAAAIAAAVDY